jgi:glycogen(starch) synthase
LLLGAFATVAKQIDGVGLVVGGSGPQREALLEQARALGIEERVALPGALSRAEVAWAMSAATAFVLPSRIEPFGIVVLEALRAGCPAVVSSRGGATEIVRDGVEGIHVDPLDSNALAAAIVRVLEDGALRDRLRAAGPPRAAEFDWGVIAEQYRAIYRGAV